MVNGVYLYGAFLTSSHSKRSKCLFVLNPPAVAVMMCDLMCYSLPAAEEQEAEDAKKSK